MGSQGLLNASARCLDPCGRDTLGPARRPLLSKAKRPGKRSLLDPISQPFNKYIKISPANDNPDTGPILCALCPERRLSCGGETEASFHGGETEAANKYSQECPLSSLLPHCARYQPCFRTWLCKAPSHLAPLDSPTGVPLRFILQGSGTLN